MVFRLIEALSRIHETSGLAGRAGMVSRSCECASQAERDTELNAFGGGQFRGPLDALVGVINSAEGLRDDDRGPGGAGRRSNLGQVSPTHWPVALPPAVLGDPAESPTCGAGELPEQLRFDPTELVTTSFPSGSKVTLLLKLTLRVTALRMNPSQQVLRPVTDALPRMVLSS